MTIGAGFSGTMLAVNLLRLGDTRVTLIDRSEAGRGLAFGAAHPTHLLNVRAGNMSALHDDPTHFVRWLGMQGVNDDAATFAPRLAYGDYLQQLLRDTAAQRPGRLEVSRGEVADLSLSDTGVAVTLASGEVIEADDAALALGNLPPEPPRMLRSANLPQDRFFADPWVPGAAAGLDADDQVLVIGTGLTMVDMVLLLDEEGFTGPIVALSRRGLLPRAHAPGPPAEPLSEVPGATVSRLLQQVRRRTGATEWRQAVDALRPVTQELWQTATPAQRGRFLRHLRPWWDVHRHRIAPEVHARLHGMIASGQLRVAAGKLEEVRNSEIGVDVTWRPRGGDKAERLTVARIVNCTGPEANLRGTADPLLRSLFERGMVRPDPLGIGIDVDRSSRVVAADGKAHSTLHALGPLTRGAFWEIVAVPDIRVQAWDVARQLS